MKTCTKCHIEKSLETFKMRKDGYRNSWCQECKNENTRTSPIQKQWKRNAANSIEPGVYMFTCLINNKRYIGESNKPARRRGEHLYSITYSNNMSNSSDNIEQPNTSTLLNNDFTNFQNKLNTPISIEAFRKQGIVL